MNQAVTPAGFVPHDARSAATRGPAPQPAPPVEAGEGARPAARRPVLSTADAPLLREVLFEGERSVARRGDLTELHARLVRQLATLGEGLAQAQATRAEQDRAAAHARLEAMEASVNRMEGALRIEFEPVLRQALDRVLRDREAPRRRPLRRAAGAVVLLLLGLGLGAAFSDPIGAAARAAQASLDGVLPAAGPSPDGGIGDSPDPAS